MTTRTAVVYSTTEGHSRLVAERIAKVIRDAGGAADLFDAGVAPPSLAAYDGVVVGGSVHAGRHEKRLSRFVVARLAELRSRPSLFFSVSLTASTRDDEHLTQAQAVVDKFVAKTDWHPDSVELVGGALAYSRYNFLKRFILRRIARAEHGDTDTSRDWDYTDWPAVEAFARQFAARLQGVHAAA